MITVEIEQGTQEWLNVKAGIPSASDFDKILTTKGEPSKQAKKYMYRLAGERITGIREEGFKNGHTERGQIVEAEAREFYEFVNECKVDPAGFCFEDQKRFGCSPDGLIGKDGGLEIKCPSMAVHVEYLLNGALPTEYFQQVQGSLLVTGRKWWDFMSFYPGLKPLILRVTLDKVFTQKLALELEAFCKNLDEITERIR